MQDLERSQNWRICEKFDCKPLGNFSIQFCEQPQEVVSQRANRRMSNVCLMSIAGSKSLSCLIGKYFFLLLGGYAT